MGSEDRLENEQITKLLEDINGWSVAQSTVPTLEKEFIFKNFVEAMEFVNNVADLAEDLKHHPDITISYNKVTISTTTHDANGLTEKDFNLAGKIDKIK